MQASTQPERINQHVKLTSGVVVMIVVGRSFVRSLFRWVAQSIARFIPRFADGTRM